MATAADWEPSEEECPICNDAFTEPKVLHCGHVVCKDCLVNWLKVETDATCPMCRTTIMENQSNQTFEAFADSLPTDLAMEAVIESQKVLNKDHPCQVCVNSVALFLCTDCGDFFCSTCVKGHQKSSVSRHHSVESLHRLTAEKLASSRPSLCSTHPGEVCKKYCLDHKISLCLECATSTHRTCPGLTDLDSMVQEKIAALSEVSATLGAEEAVLDEAIQQLDQFLLEQAESTAEAIAEMDASFDLLESALKARRQHLKDLYQTALTDTKEEVNKKRTLFFQRKWTLTTHNRISQRSCQVIKDDVIAAMTSAMKTRLNDLQCCRQLPPGSMAFSVGKVVVDSQAVSRLRRDLLKVGEVKTCTTDIAQGKAHVQDGGPVLGAASNITTSTNPQSLYPSDTVITVDGHTQVGGPVLRAASNVTPTSTLQSLTPSDTSASQAPAQVGNPARRLWYNATPITTLQSLSPRDTSTSQAPAQVGSPAGRARYSPTPTTTLQSLDHTVVRGPVLRAASSVTPTTSSQSWFPSDTSARQVHAQVGGPVLRAASNVTPTSTQQSLTPSDTSASQAPAQVGGPVRGAAPYFTPTTDLQSLSPSDTSASQPSALRFLFHGNCGNNIMLSNCQKAAGKTDKSGDGIVMSLDAMQVNMFYEVRFVRSDGRPTPVDMYLGIVTEPPDAIPLPRWSGQLKSAVVIGVNSEAAKSRAGTVLRDVMKKCRVGLKLDNDRNLYWYNNGKCKGVVINRVPDPCYFMIDLYSFYGQVITQPVIPMS
ncbi:uncharacterized protein LOC143292534 isoform X1 [Babylonia areolata]|uniref:uncharacterized protein LOC143292534 isoform X1 n=1 Tax=Babylonia areolata TaxID=304850 RepID=UPI003FD22691